MPGKKARRKVRVEVTFDLPHNPESIEEGKRLPIGQWQAQLPKVRQRLLEAAPKHRPAGG